MKAMLLAAGLGIRLRPLTDHLPKCMIPVGGKPVLQRNVEWLRDQGVTELVINLFFRPQAVTDHFGDGSSFRVRIHYSPEPEMMGTAGAVWMARHHFRGERFWVLYADNLLHCNLASLQRQHEISRASLTMALFWREDVSASGVADLDETRRIIAFKEKPQTAETSHWVNAGLYLCEPEVLEVIPPGKPGDFGHDVLPALLAAGKPLYGYTMGPGESLYWIDTPDDLVSTEARWQKENSA